jgi:hypothetical protein
MGVGKSPSKNDSRPRSSRDPRRRGEGAVAEGSSSSSSSFQTALLRDNLPDVQLLDTSSTAAQRSRSNPSGVLDERPAPLGVHYRFGPSSTQEFDLESINLDIISQEAFDLLRGEVSRGKQLNGFMTAPTLKDASQRMKDAIHMALILSWARTGSGR